MKDIEFLNGSREDGIGVCAGSVFVSKLNKS